MLIRILFLFWSTQVLAHSAASEVKIKLYKFSVSESPLCTNPIVVYSMETPIEMRDVDGTTLPEATLANGTYHCLMFEISDQVTFTSAVTGEAPCTAGQSYVSDLCTATRSQLYRAANNQSAACDSSEQRVTIFLSTSSTQITEGANPFLPPTQKDDSAKGLKLDNPIIISGKSEGELILEANHSVYGELGKCDLELPILTFAVHAKAN